MRFPKIYIGLVRLFEWFMVAFILSEAGIMLGAVASRFGFRSEIEMGGWPDSWDEVGRAFHFAVNIAILGFFLLLLLLLIVGVCLLVWTVVKRTLEHLPFRLVILVCAAIAGFIPALISMVAFGP